MASRTMRDTSGAVLSTGRRPVLRRIDRLALLALGGAALSILATAMAAAGGSGLRPAPTGRIGLLASCALATAVVLSSSTRRGTGLGTRLTAAGLAMATLAGTAGLPAILRPRVSPALTLSVAFVAATFLAGLLAEFFVHIERGRAGLLSDVVLVSVVSGSLVFLIFDRAAPVSTTVASEAITVLLACCIIVDVAGWLVLLLRCPTRAHLALFVTALTMGSSVLALDYVRRFGPVAWRVGPSSGVALSVLALAAISVVEPVLNGRDPAPPVTRAAWWVRPVLLWLSLAAALSLTVLVFVSPAVHLSDADSALLGVVLLVAVAGWTIINQFAVVKGARELELALAEKDDAITSLSAAAEALAGAESRQRLLFDSAVDGMVELDGGGTIVRANVAFCTMVGVPMRDLIGLSWQGLAGRSPVGASLAALHDTGQAILSSEGGTTYLEASASTIPTVPPGRLLLVRDVSANKAAEQTIRTLLQFLQDRDEDRSRLLQRTNAAIEAERNRIARDLHDGPVQGISGAALSLEAIRLIVEAGDQERAAEMIQSVRKELAEEAVNLRRIMSDLRPPLLEQRGLIPAVRELCHRVERELGLEIRVEALPLSEVPGDVETLAYRVVQEALSNVGKHAKASTATVRIEANAGLLEVEVRDDGRGFDPGDARQFLRVGKVGLASMRERAELSGGTFMVRSSPGTGTTVTATLPFDVLRTAPTAT